ncbi:MAG: IS481 family transposase [Pseudomonadota bacterium]|uniref:IS481 family transposase n=1 Tax=Gallaecimonas pentaromativorans TaxID=584787 RepID=UPI00067F4331|nr:IS481 family transposase [Gallaecimonas pentaromativorans]MED5525955.1 IS481 family transposase [Pseudomonadota bacterium]
MNIKLHANAATTPKVRQYIQQSTQSVAALAKELGVSETTIRRWKHRDSAQDRSHTAHNLQTHLNPVQEWLIVELRKTLLLPLDDLLTVVRRFIFPELSRSALDRCLRRHGVGNLKALLPDTEPKPSPKSFKDYEPGYVHVDVKYLPQMPDETRRQYLFVAIDRATRWVYLEVMKDKTAASASRFLSHLTRQAPFKVRIVLTDNGKEFTDRFCATGQREPTGEHGFDQVCADQQIEHRLIKPRHPQTNGMVERFNGRIAVLLKENRFASAEDLAATLDRYQRLYNQFIPQKALSHMTPLDKLKAYYQESPALFRIRPVNRSGPDS